MPNKILKNQRIPSPVREMTQSVGSGDMMLLPWSGGRSFCSAFGSGGADMFLYFICHQAADEWEAGTGHMRDMETLARDTVIVSSNNDRPVNFSAGNKDVIHDL